MNKDHLSNWQIEELLIGSSETRSGNSTWSSPDTEEQDRVLLHLENCPLCRAEKQRLEETLTLYREAALIKTKDANDAAFSRREMAARKTHSFTGDPKLWGLLWGWPARAFALLLLLAALIPGFVAHERGRRQAHEVARNNLRQEQARQEQEKDDLLLEQVDQEITESVPQPMQSLTQPVLDEGRKVE